MAKKKFLEATPARPPAKAIQPASSVNADRFTRQDTGIFCTSARAQFFLPLGTQHLIKGSVKKIRRGQLCWAAGVVLVVSDGLFGQSSHVYTSF